MASEVFIFFSINGPRCIVKWQRGTQGDIQSEIQGNSILLSSTQSYPGHHKSYLHCLQPEQKGT